MVAFDQSLYKIKEGEGSVKVCVNLTRPLGDIKDEIIRVDVIDFDNSLYVPRGAILASE